MTRIARIIEHAIQSGVFRQAGRFGKTFVFLTIGIVRKYRELLFPVAQVPMDIERVLQINNETWEVRWEEHKTGIDHHVTAMGVHVSRRVLRQHVIA